jgi:hypothetical protein
MTIERSGAKEANAAPRAGKQPEMQGAMASAFAKLKR